MTDADYQRALTKDSALQKALQQPAVLPRTGSQPEMGNPDKPADCKTLRESAARCEKAVSGSVVPTGFEPGDVTPAQPTDLRHTPNQRAAKCAAFQGDAAPIDPVLAIVNESWHRLTTDTRTAIYAIVAAHASRANRCHSQELQSAKRQGGDQ